MSVHPVIAEFGDTASASTHQLHNSSRGDLMTSTNSAVYCCTSSLSSQNAKVPQSLPEATPSGSIKPVEEDYTKTNSNDIDLELGYPSSIRSARSLGQGLQHQGGFSSHDFAQYERRLRESTTERVVSLPFPAATKLSGESSASSQSYEVSNKSDISIQKDAHAIGSPQMPEKSKPRVGSISTVYSESTVTTTELPGKRQGKILRQVRHKCLNVYRRLFTIVFTANVVGMLLFLIRSLTAPTQSSVVGSSMVRRFSLSDIATGAAANILVAILIRQDYVVNALFRTCWLVPHSMPLWFRARIAKVYEHGGIHSGAGVAGAMWFILLTVMLTIEFVEGALRSAPVLTVAYVLVILFILILYFAYPRFRFKSHNTFETTHRFAGWAAIGLFWAELILLGHEMAKSSAQSLSHILTHLPSFWMLIFVTFHIILPWLRLRRWTFTPDVLSSHAVRLNFPTTLAPLSGLAISDSPLREWHPFATFPTPGGGGSMIISKAGDWTTRTIQQPNTKYWVKGLPKTGVLSMAFVFRSVVVVTTGSGIGPCLSFLREPRRTRTACRVLWSTPSPLETYGADIYDSVLQADARAVVIDTRRSGRPDMVALTYSLFVEAQAEAVFVISNPGLTRKVVYAMETRGIPAFGPVWDS
jgi:hypothetical protein